MKNIIFYVFLLFILSCENHKKNIDYTNNYCEIVLKIRALENQLNEADLNSAIIIDSIDNLNKKLKNQLINLNVNKINKSYLYKNGFKFYGDKSLFIIEWLTLEGTKYPRVNNISFINNKANDSLSFFDSQIETFKKHQGSYILIGSNKCGPICIKRRLISFKIINNNFKMKSLVDKKVKNKEIYFEYYLNKELQHDPKFKLKGDTIICPVLNIEKTKIVGEKIYLMR